MLFGLFFVGKCRTLYSLHFYYPTLLPWLQNHPRALNSFPVAQVGTAEPYASVRLWVLKQDLIRGSLLQQLLLESASEITAFWTASAMTRVDTISSPAIGGLSLVLSLHVLPHSITFCFGELAEAQTSTHGVSQSILFDSL